MFNDFLLDHFGQQLDPGVVREAIYNTEVTVDPLSGTVYEFAERADRLGYMGRGSYDLSGLFFSFDEEDYEGPGHGGTTTNDGNGDVGIGTG